MQTTLVNPIEITPLHGVEHQDLVDEIQALMARRGWEGRPLLAAYHSTGELCALTGSHRIAAARGADTEIPRRAAKMGRKQLTPQQRAASEKRRRAYQKAYRRVWSKEKLAAGICPGCGIRPLRDGANNCNECFAAVKKADARPARVEKHRDDMRQRYAFRRANRLCLDCGASLESGETTRCELHRLRQLAALAKFRARPK